MVEISKVEIVAELVRRGTPADRAVMYADAFLEYREATLNIEKHGVIVQHPRTANPIENPYLTIRDRAAKKLASMQTGMKSVRAEFLW